MSLNTVAFWAPLAVLLYAYIGYPILLAIIGMFRRRPAGVPGYTPMVSVIIAAYNEGASIERKLRNTLELDYPPDKLEIVVVSDGSTDQTDSIAAEHRDPRIRLLRIATRSGKTHAQNKAVKYCRGEVLVFSDATSIYHRDALRYLASHYADSTVGAVSGRYLYIDDGSISPTEFGASAFWNYENVIKYFQSRISTLTGCSGCIYSVRRSLYVPLPDNACSDLIEPLHIIAAGHRVVFEHRAVAYEETTHTVAAEFLMRVRVATHGLTGLISGAAVLGFSKRPWVAFQLFSHKFLRWAAPFCLLSMLFSSAILSTDRLYRWAFYCQVAFYSAGLVALVLPLHRYWRPLGLPLYFCTLNAAALISIVQALRGRRYVIWNTVRQ
jgi:cellulose synthase/poly-beta-1,6-N-acetylglucosamine synthase-like glycosyltransferase